MNVSDEVTTSPIEVGAVAFEDEGGAVRAFICNLLDASRDVSLEFRGTTVRRHVAAGELLEVVLAGTPRDRESFPALPDVMGALPAEGA
jgi:hypothetical protein